MERARAAAALLVFAACIACSAAAPVNEQTGLDVYEGGSGGDGCYYNFQHYGEGDRIMTNEPCLNCTCHNRMLMCYLRVCPFTKPIGQDCTIEKRGDQCCPVITCPDVHVDLLTSTSTTSPAEYGSSELGHLAKYGCSISGKFYSEGSKVPSSPNKPCELCYCIRNMTTCVMQECTLHVDGCTPVYHKNVCCPVRYSCDHAEDEIPMLDDMTTTVRPTPGFLLTTTTPPGVTQDCVHQDEVFADGALIKTDKACEHCYCMKGDIVCVVQECGTPMENEGKNCASLPPREGQCCPDTYICEGDTMIEDTTDENELLTTFIPFHETTPQAALEGSGYGEPLVTSQPHLPEEAGSGLTSISPDEEETGGHVHTTDSENLVTIAPDISETINPVQEPITVDSTEKSMEKEGEDISKEEIFTSNPALSTSEPLRPSEQVTEQPFSEEPRTPENENAVTSKPIESSSQKESAPKRDEQSPEATTEKLQTQSPIQPEKSTEKLEESQPAQSTEKMKEPTEPTEAEQSTEKLEKPLPTEPEKSTEKLPEPIPTESELTNEKVTEPQFIETEQSTEKTEESLPAEPEQSTEKLPVSSSTQAEQSTEKLEEPLHTESEKSTEKATEPQPTESEPPLEKVTESIPTDAEPVTEKLEEPLPTEAEQSTEKIDAHSTEKIDENEYTEVLQTTEKVFEPMHTETEQSTENLAEVMPTEVGQSTEKLEVPLPTLAEQTTEKLYEAKPAEDEQSNEKVSEILPTGNEQSTEKLAQPLPTDAGQKTENVAEPKPIEAEHSTEKLEEPLLTKPEQSTEKMAEPIPTEAEKSTEKLAEAVTMEAEQSTEKPTAPVTMEAEQSTEKLEEPETTHVDQSTEKIIETVLTEVEQSTEKLEESKTTYAEQSTEKMAETMPSEAEQSTEKMEEPRPTDGEQLTEKVTEPLPTLAEQSTEKFEEPIPTDAEGSTEKVGKPQPEQSTEKIEEPIPADAEPSVEKVGEPQPTEAEESTEKVSELKPIDAEQTTEKLEETIPTNAEESTEKVEETLPTDSAQTTEKFELTPADAEKSTENVAEPQPTEAEQSTEMFKEPLPTDAEQSTERFEEPLTTDSEQLPEKVTELTSILAEQSTEKFEEPTPTDVERSTEKVGEPQPTEAEPLTEKEEKPQPTDTEHPSEKVEEPLPTDFQQSTEKVTIPTQTMTEQSTEKLEEPLPTDAEDSTQQVLQPSQGESEKSTDRVEETSPTDSAHVTETLHGEKPEMHEHFTESPEKQEPTSVFPQQIGVDHTSAPIEEGSEEPILNISTEIPEDQNSTAATLTTSITSELEPTAGTVDITESEGSISGASTETSYEVTSYADEKIPSDASGNKDSVAVSPSISAESSTEVITITESFGHITSTSEPKIEPQTETMSIKPEENVVTSVPDFSENEIDEEEPGQGHILPHIPGEGDCLLDGVTYTNDSLISSTNKCQTSCKCVSSIVKCEPIQCSPPPENMINCQPMYDAKESCCPTYICDHAKETVAPESHNQMLDLTTELPISEKGSETSTKPEVSHSSHKPECNSDACEANEEVIVPVQIPELCSSESCQLQPEHSSIPNRAHDESIPSEKDHAHIPGEGENLPVIPVAIGNPDADETKKEVSKPIEFVTELPVIFCSGDDCKSSSSPDSDLLTEGCSNGDCTKPATEAIEKPVCVGDQCEAPPKTVPGETLNVDCKGGDCVKPNVAPSDITVPVVQCSGDQCEIPIAVITETPSGEKCTSGNCVPEPASPGSPIDEPCEGDKCKIPVPPVPESTTSEECKSGDCELEATSSANPTDEPCEGDKCEVPSIVVTEIPSSEECNSGGCTPEAATTTSSKDVPCEGDECEKPISKIPETPSGEECKSGDCASEGVTPASTVNVPCEGDNCEIPIPTVPETTHGEECKSGDCAIEPFSPTSSADVPCEGNTCGVPTITIPEIPASEECKGDDCALEAVTPSSSGDVPCEGDKCEIPISTVPEPSIGEECKRGDCKLEPASPTSPTDVPCEGDKCGVPTITIPEIPASEECKGDDCALEAVTPSSSGDVPCEGDKCEIPISTVPEPSIGEECKSDDCKLEPASPTTPTDVPCEGDKCGVPTITIPEIPASEECKGDDCALEAVTPSSSGDVPCEGDKCEILVSTVPEASTGEECKSGDCKLEPASPTSPTDVPCEGDKCEIPIPKVPEPSTGEECKSGDCLLEPASPASPANVPCEGDKCEKPIPTVPETPSTEECKSGDCSRQPMSPESLPVVPCEGDKCEIPITVIQETPVSGECTDEDCVPEVITHEAPVTAGTDVYTPSDVPCDGEQCNVPIDISTTISETAGPVETSCIGDLCSSYPIKPEKCEGSGCEKATSVPEKEKPSTESESQTIAALETTVAIEVFTTESGKDEQKEVDQPTTEPSINDLSKTTSAGEIQPTEPKDEFKPPVSEQKETHIPGSDNLPNDIDDSLQPTEQMDIETSTYGTNIPTDSEAIQHESHITNESSVKPTTEIDEVSNEIPADDQFTAAPTEKDFALTESSLVDDTVTDKIINGFDITKITTPIKDIEQQTEVNINIPVTEEVIAPEKEITTPEVNSDYTVKPISEEPLYVELTTEKSPSDVTPTSEIVQTTNPQDLDEKQSIPTDTTSEQSSSEKVIPTLHETTTVSSVELDQYTHISSDQEKPEVQKPADMESFIPSTTIMPEFDLNTVSVIKEKEPAVVESHTIKTEIPDDSVKTDNPVSVTQIEQEQHTEKSNDETDLDKDIGMSSTESHVTDILTPEKETEYPYVEADIRPEIPPAITNAPPTDTVQSTETDQNIVDITEHVAESTNKPQPHDYSEKHTTDTSLPYTVVEAYKTSSLPGQTESSNAIEGTSPVGEETPESSEKPAIVTTSQPSEDDNIIDEEIEHSEQVTGVPETEAAPFTTKPEESNDIDESIIPSLDEDKTTSMSEISSEDKTDKTTTIPGDANLQTDGSDTETPESSNKPSIQESGVTEMPHKEYPTEIPDRTSSESVPAETESWYTKSTEVAPAATELSQETTDNILKDETSENEPMTATPVSEATVTPYVTPKIEINTSSIQTQYFEPSTPTPELNAAEEPASDITTVSLMHTSAEEETLESQPSTPISPSSDDQTLSELPPTAGPGIDEHKHTIEPFVTEMPSVSTISPKEPESPVTLKPEINVETHVTPEESSSVDANDDELKRTTEEARPTESYESPSSVAPIPEIPITEESASIQPEPETIKTEEKPTLEESSEPVLFTNQPPEVPVSPGEPLFTPTTPKDEYEREPTTVSDKTKSTPKPSDEKTQSTLAPTTEEKQKPAVSDELPASPTGPGDLPSPGEDADHQQPDQFPSPGYGAEPDYEEEDQAFGPGTCRYGGKVYVSAQQIPRDDPCDFCFCFRSDIICLQQSCPPPIHGCHEEPIDGFCCPRYECPVSMATTLNVTTTTTTTTTTLPPHFLPHAYKGAAQRRGCYIKGHTYQVGETVRASSGPCLHCTCGGDGQMKCDPKVCTPEPMLRQMIAAAVSTKRRR